MCYSFKHLCVSDNGEDCSFKERCALHHGMSLTASSVCAVAYVWVGGLLICFKRYLGSVLMMNTPAIASQQGIKVS